jgi:protein TonB
VALRLELLADGAVGQVEVAQSSGHAILDTAAREAVKVWRHTPIPREGKVVTEWVELTLTFTLDKNAATGK